MRYVLATLLHFASLLVLAQYITPHSAHFSNGPSRTELKVEMIRIDLKTPCEIIMIIGVDRKGRVVSAKVEEGTGSCSDPDVVAKATASVRARVFNAAPDAPKVQYGRVHWSLTAVIQERDEPVAMPDDVEMPPEPMQEHKVLECGGVEMAPQFPGGDGALDRYMSKFLHYPEDAKAAKKEGVVMISYIVEVDGMVSSVKLVKGVDKSLDEEALRFVRQMPKWHPGMHNGRQARVRCEVPVSFRLP